MRNHPVLIGLCLLLDVSAFNIITPQPGELISVDQLYNLTWTTNELSSDFIVSEIIIVDPYPQLLWATYSGYNYYQSIDYFNISGIGGHYLLNLSECWSPVYNGLPHGSWSISLELYDPTKELPSLSDKVQVELTSLKVDQYHKPRLPALQNFSEAGGNRDGTDVSAASAIWPVILSTVIPALLLALIIYLARLPWKRHAYAPLSQGDSVKQMRAFPTSRPPAVTDNENIKIPQRSPSKAPEHYPWTFLLITFLSIAPLLALLTALVSILCFYNVTAVSHSQSNFSVNESIPDPTAFYLNYDATRYTTVASWSSSIAPLMPGLLTGLIWYRKSQELESDAALAQYDKLLTPYQLSLLLSLKSGSLGSLWDYLWYIVSPRREKQARFLRDIGFVVLLSTLLGLGIWGADTWLHIQTSTVPFTNVVNNTTLQTQHRINKYGRSLAYDCTAPYLTSIGQNYSCLVQWLLSGMPPVLADGPGYASIISGFDEYTAIIPITLGEDRIAYIGPKSSPKETDYRANTFAVRSICDSIDEWCVLPIESEEVPLAASCGQFIGVPANSSIPIAQATVVTPGVVGAVTSFFKDQDWQDIMNVNNTNNSFYTVSRLDSPIKPSGDGLSAYSSASNSGVFFSTSIGCHTELLNFTYTSVNGSITSANIRPLDGQDLMNAIYLPSLMDVDPLLAGKVATTAMAKDADFALQNWIDAWHTHYLAFAALATVEVYNEDQQERQTTLVARIPKAPLFMLGMLLVLSILFHVVILVISLWKTKLGQTQPKQVIVSIAGLAANTFDCNLATTAPAVLDASDLFEEKSEEVLSTRIGISENSVGGHHFVAFGAQAAGARNSLLTRDTLPVREPRSQKHLHPISVTETDLRSDETFESADRRSTL